MARTSRQRRGSNAMEFALVAPVLVLLVAGIIDYGWFFFAQQTLNNSALEAARAGALASWSESPTETAEGELEASLGGSVLSDSQTKVSVSYSGLPPQVKLNLVTVSEFPTLLGMLPMPDTVESQLTMSLEDQPTYEEFEAVLSGDHDDD